MVTSGIGIVLAEALGEVVAARKIHLRTHVQVIVLLVVQHALKRLLGGYAYRAGRQACVLVCVLGRLNGKVAVEYAAACGVTNSILHCWVGLQRHAAFQTVYI